MVTRTFDIKLDINNNSIQKTGITVVQGDVNCYKFHIQLFNGSTPLDITSINHAYIIFKKADGNVIQGNLQLTDKSLGILDYTLGSQEIARANTVNCEVELYDINDSQITSSQFSFNVRQELNDDTAVQSSTQYSVLTTLINNANTAVEGANEAVTNANEALTTAIDTTNRANTAITNMETLTDEVNSSEIIREQNELDRQDTEEQRVLAENSRQESETQRNANEDIRKNQETDRQNVELLRVDAENSRSLAEVDRQNFELLRQESETQRISAESTRQAGYNAMIQASYIIPKTPVATYANIATTYPTPENGWIVRITNDGANTGKVYRYNSTTLQWEYYDFISGSAYDNLLAQVNSANVSSPVTFTGNITSIPSTASTVGQLSVTAYGRTYTNKATTTGTTISGLDSAKTYILTNTANVAVTVDGVSTATPAKITGKTSTVLTWASGNTGFIEVPATEASLTAAQLAVMYPYIVGTKSTLPFVLRAVKNTFDFSKSTSGLRLTKQASSFISDVLSASQGVGLTAVGYAFASANKSAKPVGTVYLSFDAKRNSGSGDLTYPLLYQYDINGNALGNIVPSSNSAVVLGSSYSRYTYSWATGFNSNCYYIIPSWLSSSNASSLVAEIKDIMISADSSGVVDSSKTEAYSNATLGSVGNAKDELNIITGEGTFRNNKVIFNGGESWAIADSTLTNTIMFQTTIANAKNDWMSWTATSDKFINQNVYSTDIEGFYIDGNTTNNLKLRILKSKLSTVDVAGFKTWLASNQVALSYQLLQESKIYYPPQSLIVGANYTLIVEPATQEIKTTNGEGILLKSPVKSIDYIKQIKGETKVDVASTDITLYRLNSTLTATTGTNTTTIKIVGHGLSVNDKICNTTRNNAVRKVLTVVDVDTITVNEIVGMVSGDTITTYKSSITDISKSAIVSVANAVNGNEYEIVYYLDETNTTYPTLVYKFNQNLRSVVDQNTLTIARHSALIREIILSSLR